MIVKFEDMEFKEVDDAGRPDAPFKFDGISNPVRGHCDVWWLDDDGYAYRMKFPEDHPVVRVCLGWEADGLAVRLLRFTAASPKPDRVTADSTGATATYSNGKGRS